MYSRTAWRARRLNHFIGACLMVAISGCATIDSTQNQSPAVVQDNTLVVTAVGDIMMGGSARPEMEQTGYDHPFEAVKDFLRSADVTFGNLEGPLTNMPTPYVDKKYVFRSPPDKVAPALAEAGFDVVSLANNHALDHGLQGLKQTMEALDKAGIGYAGAGENLRAARRAVILRRNGLRIAFLAYSLTFPEEFWAKKNQAGTAFGHEAYVRRDVKASKERADIVLVSFHWGREGTTELREYQVRLGRAAIDAGASAVLGHHPHVLQAVESYGEGVIMYSLGNFVFGSYSKKATRSIIAQLEFKDHHLHALRLIPINVNNIDVVFQPHALEADEARLVINHLKSLSEPLGTVIREQGNRGVVEFGARHRSPKVQKDQSNGQDN